MQPPPTPAYPQPYPAPPPAPQKKTRTVLIVVLVVIVVGVLIVGLGIYLVFSGITSDGYVQPPVVTLNPTTGGGGDWEIYVTVDRAVPLGLFEVSLTNESTGSACIPLTDVSSSLSENCSPGVDLSFTDSTNVGFFSTGDRFNLRYVNTGHQYTLRIVWALSGATLVTRTIS